MKNSKISLLLLGALAFTACSDDFLETKPEDQISDAMLFANTDVLASAANGLSLIMSCEYSSSGFGRQGYNGEATISLWYGDYKSSDAQYTNATSYKTCVTSTHNDSQTSDYTFFPWYYYYKLISGANSIIMFGDNANGPQRLRDFYVGQAYVYRAHAYTQLVALYSKRWVDSKNGTTRGVPLRLDNNTGDIACSTLGEVYDQIYSDLDNAIIRFNRSSVTRGDALWQTDLSIAHGVYSRAALAKQDWRTAADHAALARVGYPLMSAKEYEAGFNTPNDEWMWETYQDEVENLGVYGFFAYIGCNTPSSKGYKNIGSLDKGLADAIPASDSRLNIVCVPKSGESGWSTSDSGTTTKGDFYTRIRKDYKDRLTGTDGKKIYCTLVPYMSMKFMSIADRSIGNVCIMRAAEMIYNEAEALCMIGGNEGKVRELMNEAQRAYDPSYNCTASGQALLDEVKLYKRFDLWGEGRHYFDQKRWNIPMERKGWKEGGNWHPDFAASGIDGGSYGLTGKNNWCICIPAKETDFNRLINYSIEPEDWTKDGPKQ